MAKILIIDDDKAVVDSTADMLKSFEFVDFFRMQKMLNFIEVLH